MTTYSDPPRSRRAARQGEQEERQPTPPPFAAAAGSASAAPSAPAPRDATHIAAEPLIYQTQSRRPVPEYDGPSFRARRTPEGGEEGDLPTTQAVPTTDAPAYRMRDYAPERRQAPSWAPQYRAPEEGEASQLEYRTQGREQVAAAVSSAAQAPEQPVAPAPEAAAPSDGVVPTAAAPAPGEPAVPAPASPERTMTRRELRALREAQEAAAAAAAGAATASPDTALPGAPAPVAPERAEVAEPAVEAAPWLSAPPPTLAPASAPAPAQAESDGRAEAEPDAAEQNAPALEAELGFDAPSAPPVDERETPSAPEPAVAPFAEPVALVEPGEEPKRDVASVFDALFTPPSERDVVDAPPPGRDPLEFLDAAPAAAPAPAGPRADLPAPAEAEPEAEQVPVESLFETGPVTSQPAWPAPGSAPASSAPAPSAPAAPSVPSAAAPSAAAPSAASPAGMPAPSGAPVSIPAPPIEVVVEPVQEPEPIVEEPAAPADAPEPTEIRIDLDAPIADEPPAPVAGAAPDRPVNHWSNQQMDEEEGGIARSVLGGHGVVTTNALVLSDIPQPDFTASLTPSGTGEIVVTGSIDLPASLASTGAHPTQLDEAKLDHELDPGDQQVASVDSQPVRAIRAVSTHTSTRGVIAQTKPRGNRALTILIVAAAGMAVVVGTLLVVGLITGSLG
ncbi:hypothetical protein [Homoserinibacter sp. YIM 151385]|uniref:hypothetical protein n=1 Tax=Homoserinibacter sp. YIM 151385 TaxID=2985506 RepID=UPI0022F0BB87|nr:hypothetical protein [Homoserinibacter sp. YIM 151385]WBU38977.1 hypothetical protein OF852_05195 [Homoserinibacter sp. YIM 151385]